MTAISIIRIVVLITSISMVAALYTQAFKIWKTKSAQDFSGLLVWVLIANEIAWLIYGWQIHEWPVVLISTCNVPATILIARGYYKYRHPLTSDTINTA